VGLTHLDHHGKLIRQQQYHGVITRITEKGIFLRFGDGTERCVLPPDTTHLEKAKPGDYRLRSSGEVVTNPDYLAQWTIAQSPPNKRRKS
jgi:hypothetical protein